MRAAAALAAWFLEETGAVVQVKVVSYDALFDTIKRDRAAATPTYDVFLIFYTDLARLVERDALMDLTELIERDATIEPEDSLPSLYDAYSLYHGKRWALPFDGDTHVLFYRKSILARHRLSPPETWDDYAHVARTITEKERSNGIYGAAIMGHPAPVLIVSSFMTLNAGLAIAVASRTREPAVARAFAAFATRRDIALRLNLLNGGCDPTRISVPTSDEYKRFAPDVNAAKKASLKHTVAWPRLPETPQLLDVLSKQLVSALEGRVSAQQALVASQRQWQQILARTGLQVTDTPPPPR